MKHFFALSHRYMTTSLIDLDPHDKNRKRSGNCDLKNDANASNGFYFIHIIQGYHGSSEADHIGKSTIQALQTWWYNHNEIKHMLMHWSYVFLAPTHQYSVVYVVDDNHYKW